MLSLSFVLLSIYLPSNNLTYSLFHILTLNSVFGCAKLVSI